MKKSLFTGVVLALLVGNAFAGCDPSQKSVEFQREFQKVAINYPEKLDALSDELERYSEELAALAEEKTNDPQRLDRVCAKLDEMLRLLKK